MWPQGQTGLRPKSHVPLLSPCFLLRCCRQGSQGRGRDGRAGNTAELPLNSANTQIIWDVRDFNVLTAVCSIVCRFLHFLPKYLYTHVYIYTNIFAMLVQSLVFEFFSFYRNNSTFLMRYVSWQLLNSFWTLQKHNLLKELVLLSLTPVCAFHIKKNLKNANLYVLSYKKRDGFIFRNIITKFGSYYAAIYLMLQALVWQTIK